MEDQFKDIGTRLRYMRETREISVSDMAARTKLCAEEYLSYENGEHDFSFSFLYSAAAILGVDVVDIISGESPRLSDCTVVRAGAGYSVSRRKAYSYKHLAYTFREKKAEPFIVTVEPSGEKPTLHAHDGQEFNYILEGTLTLFLNDDVYNLNEGDSIYYNSALPHAMQTTGSRARFLAVVIGL
ncbi:transcriptional regulator [Clostridia bacterium]|nr:transcriptional regulator [Clostridia bacterium]